MRTVISTEVSETHNDLSINIKQSLIMEENSPAEAGEPSIIRITIRDPMADDYLMFNGDPDDAERLMSALDRALDLVTDQFAEGI